MSESIQISIPQLNCSISVSKGSNIFRALREANIPIGNACDGAGVCAQCHLSISPEGAVTPPSALEQRISKANQLPPNERVSCLVRIRSSATIFSRYWGTSDH